MKESTDTEEHAIDELKNSDYTLLEETTRVLRTRSAVIRTLLRAKDESALLQDTCATIVEQAGYRRAGVAFAEYDVAESIRWVTWVGLVGGNAEILDIDWINKGRFTYADTPSGQTAVGVAIRTRAPCVRRDVLNHPQYASEQFAALRQCAIHDGYASLSAFPLISDNYVFGALFIADHEPNAFNSNELCLLGEIADDLAFGIAGLRLREQQRKAEETIHRLAFYDCKTGLANRTRQIEKLTSCLEQPECNVRPLSLVHINVGQFSEIYNVFGQQVADQLIVETVRRLQSQLPRDLELARIGEAAFSIIMPSHWEGDVVDFARQLILVLNDPIEVANIAVDAHAHAGIVTMCKDLSDAETLFRRANAALFYGESISERITIFAGSKTEEQISRLSLMGDLRLAVQRNELRVFCQPKINMRTNQVVGAEALIRWQHPTLGMVPPANFIKLAEQSGVVVELTRWMLDNCFCWLHQWRKDGIDETLAINLSAYDLLSSSIVCDIRERMAHWNICPDSVAFELTESALVEDPRVALGVLTRLKALGVELLLDDFGTGYSSLSYLQRFPFATIKIDQSFVMPMLESADSAAIVRSTIELAHILGKRVVAEGVESAETWESLKEQDCDMAQGYFTGMPMPIEDFQRWKTAWTAAHS